MEITAVFTPRRSDVNHDMYVPRLDLERAVSRSIAGSMHSLIFGESGNGKSWMYKKVLEQDGVHYAVANCANASRFKSVTNEIRASLIPGGTPKRTGYTENKEASVKAVVAEGKLTHQNQFTLLPEEPLFEAFAAFRSRAGNKTAVLVMDNLESIFKSTELMDELADIIILLDDSRYAAFRIKLLIVGIPNGTLEYFAKTKNMESVANRIEELPKVSGMDLAQVTTLVKRGFHLLGFKLSPADLQSIALHAHHITLGVPQRVHEYCEKLAYVMDDHKGGFTAEMLRKADHEWLQIGLRQAYTVMESHLNSKRTSIARRNQVIFAIGKIKSHQFDSNTIVARLRELFPDTVTDSGMGVSTILSEMATGDSPLLTKNPKTNEYRVIDPRYIMCIRVALFLDPHTQAVTKRLFST
ncbi:AAA family ATPase [Variovorax sp. YR216]|uniref:AAA family ATPase n=1 Tax=Variovorax sp. YR216 TaxID=1882828 RepID=UPI00089C20A7|nr:AAA family ATPase [Variovorax sp. YR216]SEB22618.1 AAA domain-containing protein [Variovorax sp. YR216]